MSRPESKTNAMRILEKLDIPYVLHEFEVSGEVPDGVTAAGILGLPQEQVYKTLVTRGADRQCYVFVIPVAATLDLKKAASAAGVKSVAMLRQSELLPETGYVHGGCSPVGMKKAFPTYVEEEAMLYERITVSGGRVGHMVEVAVDGLLSACGGVLAPLITE
jgi:Cys-tRNA(Pro)/Cys-tRNA(Cys) deacylase